MGMNKNFKSNERELVKVATFFKKQSRKLIEEGRLGEEHRKVGETVDRFIEQMERHADARAFILGQRDSLNKLVKDDASCPHCGKKDMLKLAGTEKNEKGWKSNRYKCRRCNIEFTWNRPNNPWDMLQFIDEMIGIMKGKLDDPETPDQEKQHIGQALENMTANLSRLKPVIEEHEKDFKELQTRDLEMDKLIHEFKNSLLIEKIKMDTWENKNRQA